MKKLLYHPIVWKQIIGGGSLNVGVNSHIGDGGPTLIEKDNGWIVDSP